MNIFERNKNLENLKKELWEAFEAECAFRNIDLFHESYDALEASMFTAPYDAAFLADSDDWKKSKEYADFCAQQRANRISAANA